MLTENQRKKRSDDYYSSDCECGDDDDDACWEDCLLTGKDEESECECGDDDACWEDHPEILCPLTGNVGGPGEPCECGDDDACWEEYFLTGECPVFEESDIALENLEFSQDFDLDQGFAFDVGKMPKKLLLPVNVYLSSSFGKNHGLSKARQIVQQAKTILIHSSLDTKFELETNIIREPFNEDLAPSVQD